MENNPNDPNKLRLLYDAMAADEVFSQVVPNSFEGFISEYKDPNKLRTLYDALKADEVFSQVVPATEQEAMVEFGLGKPSAVPPSASGSAMPIVNSPMPTEQPEDIQSTQSSAPQYLSPEELGGVQPMPTEAPAPIPQQQKPAPSSEQLEPYLNDIVNKKAVAAIAKKRFEQSKKESEAYKGNILGAVYNGLVEGVTKSVDDAAYFTLAMLATVLPEGIDPETAADPKAKATALTDAMKSMGIKEALDKKYKSQSTTKEYTEKLKRDGGVITEGVLGLTESAFPMITPMQSGFFITSFTDAHKDIQQNMPNISPEAQLLYATTQGAIAMALEKVGISNVIKNQSVMRTLTGRTLEALKGAGGKLDGVALNETADKIVNAFAAEFETGATQYVAEESVKQIADLIEGEKDAFKFEGLEDFVVNTIKAGVAEGIGGGMMKAVGIAANSLRTPKAKEKAQAAEAEMADMVSDMQNPNVSEEAKEAIKKQVDEKAEEILESYAEEQEKFEGLPEEDKAAIESAQEQIKKHQSVIDDPNVSEASKKFAEESINFLNKDIETLLESAPKPAPTEQPLEAEASTDSGQREQDDIEAKKADIERRRQEELNKVGIKQKTAAFEKLREAKTPEEKLNAINLIDRNVAKSAILTKEEQQEIQKIKDELSSQGYEVPKILGQKYHEGMRILVTNSIPDETLAEGEEVITKVLTPQINKDDKMVQTAQIEVTVGTKKGGLTREQWLEEQKKKETKADKINAEYDAELAALEQSKKSATPEITSADFEQFDLRGKEGRQAREQLRTKYGAEAVSRMEDITKNFEQTISDLEKQGKIRKECP